MSECYGKQDSKSPSRSRELPSDLLSQKQEFLATHTYKRMFRLRVFVNETFMAWYGKCEWKNAEFESVGSGSFLRGGVRMDRVTRGHFS